MVQWYIATSTIGCAEPIRTSWPAGSDGESITVSFTWSPSRFPQEGSESIEVSLRKMQIGRLILFAGFVGFMKDTRLPMCVIFKKLARWGGGGAGKWFNGVPSGQPQSFRYIQSDQPVATITAENRGGSGGIAQDGETRREIQRTTAAKKAKTAWHHTIPFPNETGWTKDVEDQSKSACAGLLATTVVD